MSTDTDIWKLIAGPIIAMNEAEAANAAGFVELLTELAFEDNPQTKSAGSDTEITQPLKLRELAFETEIPDAFGMPQRHQIKVPLLQLVPIGGVAIDRARLKYTLNAAAIDDQASAARSTSAVRNVPAQPTAMQSAKEAIAAPLTRQKAHLPRFAGRLGQNTGQKDGAVSDGNIEIDIELRQVDLPTGLLDAFNFTRSSIRDIPLDPSIIEPPVIEEPETPIVTPPSRADELFTWKIYEQPAGRMVPGKPYNFTLELAVNPELSKGEAIDFHIMPHTAGALELMRPDKKVTVKDREKFEIALLPTDRLKDLSIRTRVGLLIEACGVKNAPQAEQFIDLPH